IAVPKTRKINRAFSSFDCIPKTRRRRTRPLSLDALYSPPGLRSGAQPIDSRVTHIGVQTDSVEFNGVGRIEPSIIFAVHHKGLFHSLSMQLKHSWIGLRI